MFTYYDCSSLADVTIPNSVTSIGDGAFYYCKKLISVNIPTSVTRIGSAAFASCSSLADITIPNSVTSIGDELFKSCSKLTSVTIPNSVTSIGSEAFYYCRALTEITIGDAVTSVGRYAFNGCSGLTSITIPNSVTNIEYYAFRNCTSLQDVYCYAETVPQLGGSVFNNSNIANVTLYVPNEAIDQYNAASQWKEFGTIKGLYDESTTKITADDILAKANSIVILPLFMSNDVTICSAQFDLTLPEGVSVDYTTNRAGNKVFTISLGTERFEDLDHTVSVTQLESGAYRFVINSNTNASIWNEDAEGNDIREKNPLLNITLKTAEGMENGDYTITINNVTLAHYDSELKKVEKLIASGGSSTLTIKNAYTVIATSIDNNMGTVALAGDHYDSVSNEADYNSVVTLTATPKTGYVFIKWTENETELSTENPISLTITENRNITAEFALLGDVYEDNVIDVADVSSVINIILNDIELTEREMKIANVYDDDEVIDVADAASVVNIILNPSHCKTMSARRETDIPDIAFNTNLTASEESGIARLGISLDDEAIATTAFQFDVKLSGGLNFTNKSLVTKAKDIQHSIAYKQISSDCVRVMLYSMTNDAICTEEENVLNIGLVLPSNMISESIEISDIKGFTIDGQSYHIDDHSLDLSSVTSINALSGSEGASPVYSLSGQQMRSVSETEKLPNGIYIINGKKINVR